MLDFQSRNIIPDIPDHFLCLWEYCEVSGLGSLPAGVLLLPALLLAPLLVQYSSLAQTLPSLPSELGTQSGSVFQAHSGKGPSSTSVLTSCCPWHRAPSTTPSGSIGMWKHTACAMNTKQLARTTMWCCVAGKVGPLFNFWILEGTQGWAKGAWQLRRG